MAEHENSIGQSDAWHTPPEIFTALGLRFSLDPCTPVDRAHYFVPADRHYTKNDDGLTQPWEPGWLVFMNPPFGGRRGHLPWLHKFFAHANGVAICRAYTDWWHAVVVPHAETLLFPAGKTKFIKPDGIVGTAPGHGIALIGMGDVANEALRRCGLGWFVDLTEGARHVSNAA
jgi:DNA N-6-adenine-methyltransferase (Dam)